MAIGSYDLTPPPGAVGVFSWFFLYNIKQKHRSKKIIKFTINLDLPIDIYDKSVIIIIVNQTIKKFGGIKK